ncbi:LCCL domain-containing protein [Ophiocordyceps camponoti-floridani]|uniref:LCCL domain-containing protein n=1 Tax=Ophiocordyceps camponoti-floridani TaxID=2030778 RepID=A0A8H4Q521_9HYPO|nr:LCCL domain-containing protein [Ophiocordyceps camponoti-floridani]
MGYKKGLQRTNDDTAMAAPASKTIRDLSGQWTMNKELSDSAEPGLVLQGIGLLIRKGIGLTTISLSIEQYEGSPRPPSTAEGPVMRIDTTSSATGFTSTSERRCVDDVRREHSDWLFGTVEGRSHWIQLDDVDDEFLKEGWVFADGEDKTLLRAIGVNKTAGWTATQTWGFQMINGERRYCRNVVIEKGEERVNLRVVYDYVG